ncbi:unnamed protein product [Auanema sp. JU1783]|nr:unnamed protein product [Auanema sp. JU1783]
MNSSLSSVDHEIKNIVVQVDNVENDIISIAKKFPSSVTYYIILFVVIILLNLLSVYLVYQIFKSFTELEFRSDKMVRKFNKKRYTSLHDDRNRFLVEDSETPPPTYDEYVKTADLYVKYHNDASNQCASPTVHEEHEY